MKHLKAKTPLSAPDILGNDEGLTLLELILVIVFSLFVIILVYQMVFFAQTAQKQAGKNNIMTNDIGIPLDVLDRHLSQTTKIEWDPFLPDPEGPYAFKFSIPPTNPEDAGEEYTVFFRAKTDGTLEMSREDGNRPRNVLILSKNNVNAKLGIPLIEYYSSVGLDGKGVPAQSLSEITCAKITIAAKSPDSDTPLTSSRFVKFQNKKW